MGVLIPPYHPPMSTAWLVHYHRNEPCYTNRATGEACCDMILNPFWSISHDVGTGVKIGQCMCHKLIHNGFFHCIGTHIWTTVMFYCQTQLHLHPYHQTSLPCPHFWPLLMIEITFAFPTYQQLVILETWFTMFELQIPKILKTANLGHWRLANVALVFVGFNSNIAIKTK